MEEDNTLKYYNDNAEKYFDQTINSNMIKIYDRFLVWLKEGSYILDFGCGSGRDSKYFLEKGYNVNAIDGSEKLCELASSYIGQNVECMRFEELDDVSKYDAIWACSSIIHVKRDNLPDVLNRMIRAIKDDGIIYVSFKIGDCEIIQDGKYFNYITRDMFEDLLRTINHDVYVLDYFETTTFANTQRPPTRWGNYLIKKR